MITIALDAEGVALFFVLSGLVITWSAHPGDSTPRFWRRRLARILPSHLTTWITAVLLLHSRQSGDLVTDLRTRLLAGFSVLYRLIRRIPNRWLWRSAD